MLGGPDQAAEGGKASRGSPDHRSQGDDSGDDEPSDDMADEGEVEPVIAGRQLHNNIDFSLFRSFDPLPAWLAAAGKVVPSTIFSFLFCGSETIEDEIDAVP